MNIRTKAAGPCGLLLLLTLPTTGCNFASLNNNIVSQTQALEVTADLFSAMTSAPIAQGVAPQLVLQRAAAHIRAARLDDSLAVPPVANFADARQVLPRTAIPSYTYACPSGGSIAVTGTYTGTYTSAPATENITEDVVETIANCADNGLTFNGNPSVEIAGTVTLANSIYTDASTVTGAFTVGSTNCTINVTVNATLNTATNAVAGTISGTACGVNITGSL